jgi:hypothetical protein
MCPNVGLTAYVRGLLNGVITSYGNTCILPNELASIPGREGTGFHISLDMMAYHI